MSQDQLLSGAQVRYIDTGGPTITVVLVLGDGREFRRTVTPEQAEGRLGKDLVHAMLQSARRQKEVF